MYESGYQLQIHLSRVQKSHREGITIQWLREEVWGTRESEEAGTVKQQNSVLGTPGHSWLSGRSTAEAQGQHKQIERTETIHKQVYATEQEPLDKSQTQYESNIGKASWNKCKTDLQKSW